MYIQMRLDSSNKKRPQVVLSLLFRVISVRHKWSDEFSIYARSFSVILHVVVGIPWDPLLRVAILPFSCLW